MSMAVVDSLQALRLLLPQNQLKDGSMAEIEVGQTSPADTTIARGHGLGGAFSLLGMMLAGALVLVLLTNSLAEPMVVGLLGLLAVAGVFLVFGLLSGFLRLSDRAAEAEMIRAVAEGLDSALQIVNAQGSVLYRNRALERLTGRRSGRQPAWRNCSPVSPIRHRPSSGSTARPSAWRRATRRSTCVRVRSAGAPAVGCSVCVRPFPDAAAGKLRRRLTLWQIDDVTRERMREIETVSGLESTLAFYDGLPQGLLAVLPDGRHRASQCHAGPMAGLSLEPGAR